MLFDSSKNCRFALLACTMLVAQNLSTLGAVIPPDRLPFNGSWQGIVGVPGGIPNRTNIYTTLTSSATAAQINAAIAACPSNEVVYLAAGTYHISSAIDMTKSYMTLRGAGMGKTILAGDVYGGLIQAENGMWTTTWGPTTPIVSASASGSTNITVSSVSAASIAVGQGMWIEQKNDGIAVFGYGNASSSTTTASNGGGRDNTGNYQVHEEVMVTAINGNTVSFWPPLYFGINTNLSPDAVGYGNNYGLIKFSGVENLTINSTNNNIFGSTGTYGFWLNGVEATEFAGTPFAIDISYGTICTEIRNCYIHDPTSFEHNVYSVGLEYGNSAWVENNVFYKNEASIFLQGSSGNAMTYNCFFREYNGGSGITIFAASMWGNHTSCPMKNLWEGNYANGYHADFYYGPSVWNTLFRNYLTGTDPDVTYNRIIVDLDSHQWSNSVVGNVLGSVGNTPATYYALPNTTIVMANQTPLTWIYDPGSVINFPQTENVIYRLGYPDISDNGASGTDGSGGISALGAIDLTVRTNTLIADNWDYANQAIVNPTNIPSSYIYSGKPAWWGSSLPWPPYDPSNSSTASMTNIPAGYWLVFGTNPPASGVSSNQPPVAVASASPVSGSAPLTVTFSSAGSSDPEGATLTYNWTFGDGTTSTAANPSHTYQSAGTFAAQVSVSDGVNTTTSSNVNITVTNAVNNLPVPQGLQVL